MPSGLVDRRHRASRTRRPRRCAAPPDRTVIDGELIQQLTFTGTPDELRKRLADVEAAGATEVVFQPSGDDIERELTAFAEMAELTGP